MTFPGPFTANLILDSAPEGILCLDLEGRIAFANKSALRMLGYDTAGDLVGQPIWSHMQFLEAPSGTVVTWREDGSSMSVEYAKSPVFVKGQVGGTVVSFHDVTTRCASEHKKDELISTVSHELRTPLTAIRSALGLLVGGAVGPLPETGRRMLEIGVKNTDRLIRLVNDILDLE